MPDLIWTGAYGRLKAIFPSFLSNEFLLKLVKMSSVREIADALENTWYKEHIEAAAAMYELPELIEVALNRHLVRMNTLALNATPPYEKRIILSYLSKWDIENINLILAAKALGKSVSETEGFLVSPRNFPVGLSGQTIPFEELRSLLSQPDLVSVINSLVKYGFGTVLLQQLSKYQKTLDLGVFGAALQNYYYSNLLWSLRFVHGNEGPIREYVRAEITKLNFLNLVKARLAGINRETLRFHLIEGGFLSEQALLEAYSSPSVSDMVQRFDVYFNLSEAYERFANSGNLSELEVAVDRAIASKFLTPLKTSAPSAAFTLYFLFRVEKERENIRRIVYGKHYSLPEENISSSLLLI
ncbi:hypothetical protein B9P99_03075 [Candidatus Marsarchaeota G1 archaeon OSP_B]|jgi:V/A-type H+-transporting ATPase subunit C|uniref:V-ATPase subunit C n=5 Tax=Candidatus Marsarchaeota TaxID=1978152 RepID=A0A2R6AI81_9ARCH|nr:MAG: hypothetical protein B9Q01_03845 [Candidatus Marsarchaeota G1 archaeon OSP_D]PSN86053.1 MAG: hypothetical protein B9Q02_03890 [Candidatus Marsarchaeota G1 archaeon BE_D]PSN88499.1 MAG: hypothetical protein B9Q00_05320 [Candidatus Marsarchaeota G1 archaeon OSP_C]PSN92902.1 MAG: hypothetical protein B9P99_03075 [Candidatus Marsarchaeota G1 archaeon OSP_B]